MSKIMHGFSYLVLVSAMFFIIYFVYLVQFDQNPPMVYNNLPFNVTVGENSEYIIIHFDACRKTDAPSIVTIGIVDTFIYALPIYSASTMKKGECAKRNRRIELPPTLPEGMYHIEGKSEFRVNVLAIRSVSFITKEFNITRGVKDD